MVTQIDQAEDKSKDLSKHIEDLGASIADNEELIASLTTGIKKLVDGVSETRKNEHGEYIELIKSDSVAKELLGYAKNRLNTF